MIEFLFVDLDDTVLDFGATERKSIIRLLQTVGVHPTEEIVHRYHVINLEHWKMLERGELTRNQLGKRRFDVLFQELGVAVSTSECERLYRQFLSEGDDVLPGAAEALAALSKKYRLFAATNSSVQVQAGRLERTGLGHHFEKIFISEEIGVNKPAKDFFDRCFARIPGFDPAKAMMVGDSLTSDILGGIRAGIATCWVNPSHAPGRPDIRPDHEIEALYQLEALLDTL